MATRAETLILTHINECAENRKAIMARFDQGSIERKAQRDELNRIVNRGLVWMIGLLIVCLGYFLARFGLPGIH